MHIIKGYVVRWFNVDFENQTTEIHDKIFDALIEMKNAKEVNSGHTGFNIAFEDDGRSDSEIKESIRKALSWAKIK
jgi:hypothetical protein